MQLNLVFVTTLLLVNCKANDAGINVNTYSSNIGPEKADTAAHQSLTTSALNALADVIAKGGHYIIDASSLGGGVLVGNNGNLQPYASQTKGKYTTDGTAQLLQNLRYPALQKQSNPLLTFPTKVFPKLAVKPQSISSPRKPHISMRPVSKPFVKAMVKVKQTSRKYKPVNIPQTAKDVNSLIYTMPDFTMLKFLDLHSSNFEGDFDF